MKMVCVVCEGDPVNGPYTKMWGQKEWIDPRHPERLPKTVTLRRGLHRDSRPFMIQVRLTPPAAKPLRVFADEAAKVFGLQRALNEPEPDDRSVQISGACMARDAQHAMKRCIDMLCRKAEDLNVGSVAIRVWQP